ncbi:MAG: hypothetical protein KJ007_02910 [Burkholderiales bacterium]|nr:hypothetical protein [Burkholderiales bacterium]
MRFVRVVVSQTQNRVVAVLEQDTPFNGGGYVTIAGEECETQDLGVVEDQSWTRLDGTPCGVTRHLLERLESGSPDVRRIHDAPCTMDGIKARLRERGPAGIPIKVRAWLATVLPADQVAAMGLARGIPVAALKSCDAIRAARDPDGGSRRLYFERITHRQSERRAAKSLARRRAAAAKGKP